MTALPHLVCQRCGHGSDPVHPWIPRKLPVKMCPKCKTKYWNQAKKKKDEE